MLGMMTPIMASTMANVAIADIMGAFGIGQNRVHWLQTGFLSATTVFMLLNGWFVNNLGMRRTFLLASVVFTVASLFGQLAPTFEGVVLARVVQGACAGLLQPLGGERLFGDADVHQLPGDVRSSRPGPPAERRLGAARLDDRVQHPQRAAAVEGHGFQIGLDDVHDCPSWVAVESQIFKLF